MFSKFNHILAFVFLVLLTATASAKTDSSATSTMSSVLHALNQIEHNLNQRANTLLEQGHVSPAQQQRLMASTIKKSSKSIAAAFEGSLQKRSRALNSQEKVVLQNANSLLALASSIDSDVKAQQPFAQLQGAANQLLSGLPLNEQVPVYYGFYITPGDGGKQPQTLQIFGSNLSSKELDWKNPQIKIDGHVIAAKNIKSTAGRIDVQLTDEIKNLVNFGSSGCEASKPMRLDISVDYIDSDTVLWFFDTESQQQARFTDYALTPIPSYQVLASYVGTQRLMKEKSKTFRKVSPRTTASCEQSNNNSVSFQIPEKSAYNIKAASAWVDKKSILKESSQHSIDGRQVTASGSIHGKNKDVWFSCEYEAEGNLELTGRYNYLVSVKRPASGDIPSASALNKASSLNIELPAKSRLKLSKVNLVIKKDQCEKELDHIEISDLGGSKFTQKSANGLFSAHVSKRHISVTVE